jgi:CO/xanthine dehydrogenase FAD-binding subunit
MNHHEEVDLSMIRIQNYVMAESLEEAYQLNQNKRSRIIGGMLWLKMSNIAVHTAIDLSRLGLNEIEETEEEFSIGAMTTLRQLELHKGLNTYANGAVAKAVHDIVGVQFRNMATVGGSLFGRFGFSDVLTVFLAMDACVELYKGGIVSLEEFVNMEKDRDILVRLIVKKKPGCFAYQAMRNQRTDFPVLTCAVSKVDGEYRVVVGARPARARVLRDEQGLLSGGVTEESAKAFAAFAAETLPTGSNVRGTAEYRTHLIRVLTRRTLMELEG